MSCKNILSDIQFGFRKGYSTELAVNRVAEKISKKFDKEFYGRCSIRHRRNFGQRVACADF